MKTRESSAALKAHIERELTENERKWTPALLATGFTTLPSIILERQNALGLDAIDVNLLLQLAKHWWYADNLPHPGIKAIATAMGVHPRTVQRHLRGLMDGGFVEIVERKRKDGGHATNVYSFRGLIEKATPFAEEAKTERERHRKEKEERLRRKRPRLAVVKSDDA